LSLVIRYLSLEYERYKFKGLPPWRDYPFSIEELMSFLEPPRMKTTPKWRGFSLDQTGRTAGQRQG
jgi:hypothetical protein